MRAACALARHHIRVGDRVGLRVLGRTGQVLGPGSGVRHQRRFQELLALVQPGWPEALSTRRLRLRIGAGSVVVVLTPAAHARRHHRDRDALPARAGRRLHRHPRRGDAAGHRAATHVPRGAWPGGCGMVEREIQLTEVARRGIPVVPWRGPGSLDEVLRRLARRSRMPREVPR